MKFNGKNVLVTGGSRGIGAEIAAILADEGFDVTSVESGEDGLEALDRGSYDAVLLDVWLPGIDGLETYRRMLAIRPNQRAIIASGYSENHRVREAQRLGAGTYVRKPYMLEKIGIAVRRELDRPAA